MKVLAMYLPQFHRVPENDEWWGEGFTDWEAAKQAKPLYPDHYQPRIPLNRNYYDLMQEDTMVWQAELMTKYQVDGMCMYHYWFENGRRILEKPAENLLKWKHINMPFCFCWANETWARSWSNVIRKDAWANPWASTFETKEMDRSKHVLLQQKYGGERQWAQHFEYLMPFFKDDRYIKIDEKPVFIILKTKLSQPFVPMLECWQNLAEESGLKGLYIIGSEDTPSAFRNYFDALMRIESQHSRKPLLEKMRHNDRETILDYDEVWENILNHKVEKNTYAGGFVSYDDSPRRGKQAIVIENANPDKFRTYLTELMAKNAANEKDIVFINAWNEWGEGMYLEPDEKYGTGFLEAIPYAKKNFQYKLKKYTHEERNAFDREVRDNCEKEGGTKSDTLFELMDLWMTIRENGGSIADWIVNAGYKEVATYGYGVFGKHLYRELIQNDAIKLKYVIDQKEIKLQENISVFSPIDDLPDVDAVIVSVIGKYSEIYQVLKEKNIKNIISLEAILQEGKWF